MRKLPVKSVDKAGFCNSRLSNSKMRIQAKHKLLSHMMPCMNSPLSGVILLKNVVRKNVTDITTFLY